MPALAERLRRMSREELSWRARTALRTQVEQIAAVVRKPRWRRDDIRSALSVETLPEDIRSAVDAGNWVGVHQSLWRLLRARPSRFVVNHAASRDLVRNIHQRWPDAAGEAERRADANSRGTFDLLGYRELSFTSPASGGIDWHLDPVHQRRMPMAFWSRVPFLDPASGDHKIIWELNRQQHWLSLGRTLWLTGNQACAGQMVRELRQWLDANPPLTGGNWSSMLELAFRSLSWLWGLHTMLTLDDAGDEPWLVDLFVALDRQLTHVEHNLSLYFSPNTHLTGEALALYVAGTALPELAGSSRWVDTGRRVLLDEIDRQVERDGGHVERSTHYHRYTLDFYLLALLTARRAGDTEAEERFADALGRLAPFAFAMADRNGRLPRIGDDDGGALWPIAGRDSADIRDSLGVAAAVLNRGEWAPWGATEEALWLTSNDPEAFARALNMGVEDRRVRERRTLPFTAAARRGGHPATSSVLAFPGAGRRPGATERRRRMPDRRTPPAPTGSDRRVTHAFLDTGYVTTATGSGDHLVLDAGPHGYLNGGHAHADALSVVLTLRGLPLLIDPGTPTYTMDPELRDHLRSSISHNTVTIDGTSSAVPRGPFHWQTRADATLETLRFNSAFAFIEARHDAYGRTGHRRIVLASGAGYLFVDQVTGEGSHEAAQYWHLDPQWHVASNTPQALRLVHDAGMTAWLLHERGGLWLVNGDEESPLGWISPAYGVRVPSWTARVTQTAAAPFALVSWCGVSASQEAPALERVPCSTEPGGAAIATRIRHGDAECVTVVRPGDGRTGARRTSAGAFETDARFLQYSLRDGVVTSLCLADGTYVRDLATGRLTIESGEPIPDLHVAWRDDGNDVTTSANRVVIHGREWTGAVARADVEEQHDVRYRRIR